MTVAVLFLAQAAQGQDDATAAWRKILKKCAASADIGKESLFFGVSNTVGPGSVWRFADDQSVRLMYEHSDAFPQQATQAAMISNGTVSKCLGDASSSWDLRLILPFSTGATPLSFDLNTELGRARSITVSVKGWAIDVLKETVWKNNFRSMAQNNPYKTELNQPNRILAENVVKVTGLQTVFMFSGKLSVQVQAKFRAKTFTLGDGNSRASSAAKKPASSGGGDTKAAGSGTKPDGGTDCGASSNSSNQPAKLGVTANGNSGAATLHADVIGDNEITICADGPFYLLAAYSKLAGGNPVGVKNSTTPPPVVLVPAAIPARVKVGTDRK